MTRPEETPGRMCHSHSQPFSKLLIDHVHCDRGTEKKNHLLTVEYEVDEQVQIPGGEEESERI